jgi:hypothetical protein
MRDSADPGVQVEGHPLDLARRHADRSWIEPVHARRPHDANTVGSRAQGDAICPVGVCGGACTHEAASGEGEHDTGRGSHARHARHTNRRRRRQQNGAVQNTRTSRARGVPAGDDGDTGGNDDAADHTGHFTPRYEEGRRTGRPSSTPLPSASYGAMRAMCVFQLPSSRRASNGAGRPRAGPQCPTVASHVPRLQLLWISSEAIQMEPLSSSAAP